MLGTSSGSNPALNQRDFLIRQFCLSGFFSCLPSAVRLDDLFFGAEGALKSALEPVFCFSFSLLGDA